MYAVQFTSLSIGRQPDLLHTCRLDMGRFRQGSMHLYSVSKTFWHVVEAEGKINLVRMYLTTYLVNAGGAAPLVVMQVRNSMPT